METPQYIGRYRVIRSLGAGGMGEVFFAHDARIGRDVAIKRLAYRGKDTDQQRKRFRREANSTAMLDHPAIIKVYDVITDGDHECIVMEYVDGTTLRERITCGDELSVREIVHLGWQIADGMAAAHARGIIHRDLKSENVLLDRNGNVKIIDFGIAKVLGDQTLTEEGKILGTYKSMSPEQIRGTAVKEPSDLFSFGILLYESLTGELPFTGAGLEQIVESITRHQPPSLCTRIPGLPEALSGLIDQLLQKIPSLRPQSFREVAEILQEIGNGLSEGTEALVVASAGKLMPPTDGESTEDLAVVPGQADARVASMAPMDRPLREGAAELDRGKPERMRDAAVHRSMDGVTSRQFAAGQPSSVREAPPVASWRQGAAIARTVSALGILVLYAAWLHDVARSPSQARPDLAASAAAVASMEEHDPASIRPRYIAVLPIEVSDGCVHDTVFVTRTIHHETEQALLSLTDVQVIAEAEREPLTPRASRSELARALAADELLTTRVDCYPDRILIEIQRIAADGSLHSQSSPFEIDVSDLGLSSATLRQQIRSLYSEFEPRADVAAQEEARTEDLEKFRRLRQDYWRKRPRISHEEMLKKLEEILTTSPRFLEAYVFAAELWMYQYQHDLDRSHLDRAWALMEQARAIAPSSQRVLLRSFTVALTRGDTANAEIALNTLDMLNPGSGVTLYLHALVHEYRDDTPGARALLQKAAERHPSWRILYHLAKLDMRMGDIQAARQHLDAVFARSPENLVALQLEKQLEGRTKANGDVSPLSPSSKHAYSVLVNHAAELMNVQRYSEAIPFLEQARSQRPRAIEAIFNLAEVLILAGEAERGRQAFQEVLAMIPAEEVRAFPLAVKAQAFAHIGRFDDARTAIERALERKQDIHLCYAAAVVHALAGDTAIAVQWAERAIAGGYARQWFNYPWFARVREESPLLRGLSSDDHTAPARD